MFVFFLLRKKKSISPIEHLSKLTSNIGNSFKKLESASAQNLKNQHWHRQTDINNNRHRQKMESAHRCIGQLLVMLRFIWNFWYLHTFPGNRKWHWDFFTIYLNYIYVWSIEKCVLGQCPPQLPYLLRIIHVFQLQNLYFWLS